MRASQAESWKAVRSLVRPAGRIAEQVAALAYACHDTAPSTGSSPLGQAGACYLLIHNRMALAGSEVFFVKAIFTTSRSASRGGWSAAMTTDCERCAALRELLDIAAGEQGLAQRRMLEAQEQRDKAIREVTFLKDHYSMEAASKLRAEVAAARAEIARLRGEADLRASDLAGLARRSQT